MPGGRVADATRMWCNENAKMHKKRNSLALTFNDDRPAELVVSQAIQAADRLLGTVIDGRYRVEGLLGHGGMGLVYRATHTHLRKTFAIKVLRERSSRDPNAMARFQREAESASAIGNAHIVDISDFGTLPDGSTYFVMEHLQGVDLVAATDDGVPMPVERACHIAIQLCGALGAAHEIGIVHRDLKPENVFLINRDGHLDFVKVLDFGIAKVAHGPSPLTLETEILGTPHYMSPEQSAGLAIDHRTDIYALGVLLYEMLSTRVPFDAETAVAILHKHVHERPTPIDLYVPNISSGLKRIIGRCLEKKPERRYQSMDELRADLERVQQSEAGRPAPLNTSWRAWAFFPRSRPLVWAGLLTASLLAFFGAIALGAFASDGADAASLDRTAEDPALVSVEHDPPAPLAQPVESHVVSREAPDVSPPASLARSVESPPAHSSPREARNPIRKRRRQPVARPKPQQKTASSDEVLDPWY